jgi:hypothetical protein
MSVGTSPNAPFPFQNDLSAFGGDSPRGPENKCDPHLLQLPRPLLCYGSKDR